MAAVNAQLRAVIADDEKPARSRLRRLLMAFPEISVVAEAEDGLAALAAAAEHAPDLLFLDIDMPELTGLEVAAALLPSATAPGSVKPTGTIASTAAKPPYVIFCTAYDQHAVKAFELHAVDYLLKPIEEARLAQAVQKVSASANRAAAEIGTLTQMLRDLGQLAAPKPARLALRTGAKFVVCEVAEIAAISAKDHYSEVTWGQKQLLVDDSLDDLEQRLPKGEFLRVHRGAIIGLRHLRELRRLGDRKYVAVMNDYFCSEVPVSRERLSELKMALGIA